MSQHQESINHIVIYVEGLHLHPLLTWLIVLALHTTGKLMFLIGYIASLSSGVMGWSEAISFWLASIVSAVAIFQYGIKVYRWFQQRDKK